MSTLTVYIWLAIFIILKIQPSTQPLIPMFICVILLYYSIRIRRNIARKIAKAMGISQVGFARQIINLTTWIAVVLFIGFFWRAINAQMLAI